MLTTELPITNYLSVYEYVNISAQQIVVANPEEITEVPSKGLGAVSWLKGQHVQCFTQMQIQKRNPHAALFL